MKCLGTFSYYGSRYCGTIIEIKQNPKTKKLCAPPNIKRMFNRRKYLLRIERCNNDGHHLAEIRALNKSIRSFHADKRRSCVRRAANGASGSIWRAVGAARDLNPYTIPANLTVWGGGVSVDPPKGCWCVCCTFLRKN